MKIKNKLCIQHAACNMQCLHNIMKLATAESYDRLTCAVVCHNSTDAEISDTLETSRPLECETLERKKTKNINK